MGNCLKSKEQPQILTSQQICPNCHKIYRIGELMTTYQQHCSNCHPIPRNRPEPQIIRLEAPIQQGHQQQQANQQDIHIEIQEQHQPRVRANLGQYIMDDFRNSKIKYYWCKELLSGSKIKYKWAKKVFDIHQFYWLFHNSQLKRFRKCLLYHGTKSNLQSFPQNKLGSDYNLKNKEYHGNRGRILCM